MFTKSAAVRARSESRLFLSDRDCGELAAARSRSELPGPETPLYAGFRDTPAQHLQFLNEEIERLSGLLAEQTRDPWDISDILELNCERGLRQEQRSELLGYFRALARLPSLGDGPRYYDDWLKWVRIQLDACAHRATDDKAGKSKQPRNYSDWLHWAHSKKTLVRVPNRPTVAMSSDLPKTGTHPTQRKKRRLPVFSFKLICGRMSFAMSFIRFIRRR